MWVAVNLLGAVAFVAVASISWTEPEVRDVPGASGGAAFVWALSALPIAATFVLLDLGVVIWAWAVHRQRGASPVSTLSWLVPAVWAFAVVFDCLHH